MSQTLARPQILAEVLDLLPNISQAPGLDVQMGHCHSTCVKGPGTQSLSHSLLRAGALTPRTSQGVQQSNRFPTPSRAAFPVPHHGIFLLGVLQTLQGTIYSPPVLPSAVCNSCLSKPFTHTSCSGLLPMPALGHSMCNWSPRSVHRQGLASCAAGCGCAVGAAGTCYALPTPRRRGWAALGFIRKTTPQAQTGVSLHSPGTDLPVYKAEAAELCIQKQGPESRQCPFKWPTLGTGSHI